MSSNTSRNFSEKELACKCCGVNGMDVAFVSKLQELRDLYNRPLILTSAYRCKKHNAEIKGSQNSYHCLGLAVDIHAVSPDERFQIINIALSLGFRGIGIDAAFVHIDMRPGLKVCFLY